MQREARKQVRSRADGSAPAKGTGQKEALKELSELASAEEAEQGGWRREKEREREREKAVKEGRMKGSGMLLMLMLLLLPSDAKRHVHSFPGQHLIPTNTVPVYLSTLLPLDASPTSRDHGKSK